MTEQHPTGEVLKNIPPPKHHGGPGRNLRFEIRAQRIDALNQAASRAVDPRMKEFWKRTEKMILRKY